MWASSNKTSLCISQGFCLYLQELKGTYLLKLITKHYKTFFRSNLNISDNETVIQMSEQLIKLKMRNIFKMGLQNMYRP